MIAIVEQTISEPNPEIWINAAIAATAARDAATMAFYLLVAVLIVMVVGVVVGWVVLKRVNDLAHNTDGMRVELVAATRKLALIEGNVIGRAEQKKEETATKEAEAIKEAIKVKPE
jgi:hypothetical protein